MVSVAPPSVGVLVCGGAWGPGGWILSVCGTTVRTHLKEDPRVNLSGSCRRATGGGVSGALVSVLHLKWYINTMHVGRYGMLDKRVFHRMCCTLQQRYKGYDNFFRTLLTQNELEIIDYVATQSKQLLPRLLATFFHQHIAFSPLLFFRFWRSLG